MVLPELSRDDVLDHIDQTGKVVRVLTARQVLVRSAVHHRKIVGGCHRKSVFVIQASFRRQHRAPC
jgi:hypothetical protein